MIEQIIAQDEKLTGSGRWLRGEYHDSLIVDTQKQIFFWNSKGLIGDVYTWLTKVRGLTYEQAKELLKSTQEFSGSFIHTIRKTEEFVVYPRLVDVFYENALNSDLKYWTDRGINIETVHRFRLGLTGDDWNTIPIYQDGLFRNFQLRRDNPKAIKSYYKGLGTFLFNSDIMRITDSIIITEGPTDCLRLLQEGLPAVSHNGGSENWQLHWFKYFMLQKNIIIVYDNDLAGREGAKKVAKNLGEMRCKIYTFEGFEDKYDVIDFFRDGGTKEQFTDLIKNKSKYSFEMKGNYEKIRI